MMQHTEIHSLNIDQIYAGRKGRTVHDCLVNLQLTYEISQTIREPMAIIFNDMAGCYDRIRLNLNTITSRRIGMTKHAAIAHAKTITNMHHNVCTSFGDSSNSISPSSSLGVLAREVELHHQLVILN